MKKYYFIIAFMCVVLLSGRLPNAEKDMFYIVLTNNDKLTFDEVAKSMYSSSLEDRKVMEESVVVEMK